MVPVGATLIAARFLERLRLVARRVVGSMVEVGTLWSSSNATTIGSGSGGFTSTVTAGVGSDRVTAVGRTGCSWTQAISATWTATETAIATRMPVMTAI